MGSDHDSAAPDTSRDTNVGDAFMLAEFENMRYFHEEDTAISERRVDILLAVTSGIAAGLALLAQTGIDSQFLLSIALLGCLGLLLIGVPAFFDTLRRDIRAVDYIHALNSVRAYFAQRAPAIRAFLRVPAYAHYPEYGSLSSSRRASAAINSLAGGVFVAALRMLAFHERRPDILAVIVGLAEMLVIFGLHVFAWNTTYAAANRNTKESGSVAMNEAAKLARRLARRHSARLRQQRAPDQSKN